MTPRPSFRGPQRRGIACLLTIVAIACSACSDASAPKPTPPHLTRESGDAQSGTVGGALWGPLVVRLLDADGNGVAGVSVAWSVTAGGGSVSPASTTTGVDGRATTTWTLGTAAGAQSVAASIPGGTAADFHATATMFLPLDRISLSYTGGCAVARDSRGYCWGSNPNGQLGDGTTTNHYTPVPLASAVRWKEITLSAWHACGIATTDDVYCWGMGWIDAYPTLDTLHDVLVPTRIVTDGVSDLPLVTVAPSFDYTCALGRLGRPYCWGNEFVAWTSPGPQFVRAVQIPSESGPTMAFTQLAVGALHACALDATGQAYCWGGYANGELGDGVPPYPSFRYRWFTRPVLGGLHFSMIRAGDSHTCALTADGTAYCWGFNATGQLGDGSTTSRTQPVAVLTPLKFREIAPGSGHTCALALDGRAYCWGDNTFGQLGIGTRGNAWGSDIRTSPVAVLTDLGFARIASAPSIAVTCAIQGSGQGYCWGTNQMGGLGDGNGGIGVIRMIPTPIRYP